MSFLWTSIVSLGLAWTLYNIISFLISYQAARKIGLPICVVPVDPQALWFRVLSVALRPVFQAYLPGWLSFRLEMITWGGQFLLRDQPYHTFGSAWTVVGPGRIEIWSGDPALSQQVLQYPKQFHNSKLSSEVIGFLGENASSANGDTWTRHRKIIAPLLNERISNATWDESISQASSMTETFLGLGKSGTDSAIEGCRTIAINVLSLVAYGQVQPWALSSEEGGNAFESEFMAALSSIARRIDIAALIPLSITTSTVMPVWIQEIGAAVKRFPKLTEDLISRERSKGETTSTTILSTMIKTLDQEKNTSQKLNEDEVRGNLLQFTLAGFDTTANTMAYALVHLAAYPKWQKWVREEIDEIHRANPDYTTAYPQLKRTLALMLEVLRLYTPLVVSLRTSTTSSTLTTSSGVQVNVPPHTTIGLSSSSLHVNPESWGKDALLFKPDRWIDANGDLIEPPKGSFTPWSAGPRVCPGMKMARVEFVATIYTILGLSTVQPVAVAGENIEVSRQKLLDLMWDSQPVITLQMNNPRKVVLEFARRDGQMH